MFNIVKFIETLFGTFLIAPCFITFISNAVFIMLSYILPLCIVISTTVLI